MAIKEYFTFLKAPRQEPHYQIFLMSYPRHSLGVGSDSSAVMQSVYSTAPADWAIISKRSISSIDETLTGTTTPGQSRPGCNSTAPEVEPNHWMYVVPLISFQTFFVQAFKIVIDSWKFTMLLLYILWDDWPIFMISGSKEQLQQQLEYTLLKPDCHSWWILKMQSGHEDTLEEQYAIKFCFKLGKNATKMYGMLQTAFRPSCVNWASVFEWHKRFKEGREFVRDDERCGRSKEVNTPELIGQRVRVRVTMLRF